MKTRNNILTSLLAAALALALLLSGCGKPASSEAANGGVKHITLTVTYADGHEDSYEIDTDAEYLKGAVETVVELEGSDGEYGFYIHAVNGEVADFDADGAYWCIYVNGEYGMYGIDAQPVADGDSFGLVYTVG